MDLSLYVCAQDNIANSFPSFLQALLGSFSLISFYIYKFDLHLVCYQVYAVDASNIAVQVLCWTNFQLLRLKYGV